MKRLGVVVGVTVTLVALVGCHSDAERRHSSPTTATLSQLPGVHTHGTFRASPTSAAARTTIAVSGGECSEPHTPYTAIDVIVNITTLDRRSGLLGAVHVPTQPDGSWASTLAVRTNGNPATAYRINAMCMSGGDILVFEYPSLRFRLLRLR